MQLDLTDDERALLAEVLRDQIGVLKAEINRTETHDFKDELKAREALLTAIATRLGGAESAA
jgi:uncharacterized small protein (DUF1192 family)